MAWTESQKHKEEHEKMKRREALKYIRESENAASKYPETETVNVNPTGISIEQLSKLSIKAVRDMESLLPFFKLPNNTCDFLQSYYQYEKFPETPAEAMRTINIAMDQILWYQNKILSVIAPEREYRRRQASAISNRIMKVALNTAEFVKAKCLIDKTGHAIVTSNKSETIPSILDYPTTYLIDQISSESLPLLLSIFQTIQETIAKLYPLFYG